MIGDSEDRGFPTYARLGPPEPDAVGEALAETPAGADNGAQPVASTCGNGVDAHRITTFAGNTAQPSPSSFQSLLD